MSESLPYEETGPLPRCPCCLAEFQPRVEEVIACTAC